MIGLPATRAARGAYGALLCFTTIVAAVADTGSVAGVREVRQLSLDELLNVEITSVSRRPENLANAASAVQVISAEEIRRSGATRLPEALRLAGNLQVAQYGADGWAIASRGFNNTLSNKLLVLIDGRTIYSPLFAGVFWESQDLLLDDIARIEVISGPGSSVWGANAVNGVINVISKPARDTQGVFVKAGAGTELTHLAMFRYGDAVGQSLQYRVYGKFNEWDGLRLPATGMDTPDDTHRSQGGFRLDWQPSTGHQLTLQGDAYETRVGQALSGDAESRGNNLLLHWSRTLPGREQTQLRAYFDSARRLVPGQYGDSLDTWDLDLQHQRSFTRHNVVAGLNYRLMRDDFDNLFFVMRPERATLRRLSGFVQDTVALGRRWQLTLGTKVEDNEYTGGEWQPSVRLAWTEATRTYWGAVSRAVRTPSRFEQDLFVPDRMPFIVGSAGYGSEVLIAVEAGARVQPTSRTVLSASVFHNDYDELRTFERVDPALPVPLTPGNRLEGDGRGLELWVDHQLGPGWQLRAGYTWLDLDLKLESGSTDPLRPAGSAEALDPDHQFFLRSTHNFGEDWEFDAMFRFVDDIANRQVPAYGELDLRLGWYASDNLQLAIVGRNLLDAAHGEFGPPGRAEVERSVFGQVTLGF